MAEINGVHVPFVPLVDNDYAGSRPPQQVDSKFKDLLDNEISKVKFSSHASKRLEDRNIILGSEEMARIENAVQKAELKGAKDSLVMMGNNAFIINVPNKTVVTAVPLGIGEDVFTNIDSVVFT